MPVGIDLPAKVRAAFGMPIELTLLVDDLTGSVLDDPHGDDNDRALVELARLLLYAHDNADADTDPRFAKLQQLFDTVMGREGPGDGEVVWTYVTAVFEPSSRIYLAMLEAIEKRKKQEEQPMYASIDNPCSSRGVPRASPRAVPRASPRAVPRASPRAREPRHDEPSSAR